MYINNPFKMVIHPHKDNFNKPGDGILICHCPLLFSSIILFACSLIHLQPTNNHIHSFTHSFTPEYSEHILRSDHGLCESIVWLSFSATSFQPRLLRFTNKKRQLSIYRSAIGQLLLFFSLHSRRKRQNHLNISHIP